MNVSHQALHTCGLGNGTDVLLLENDGDADRDDKGETERSLVSARIESSGGVEAG